MSTLTPFCDFYTRKNELSRLLKECSEAAQQAPSDSELLCVIDVARHALIVASESTMDVNQVCGRMQLAAQRLSVLATREKGGQR